jgi:glycosyltransferase involved in cell wall biosynthesis
MDFIDVVVLGKKTKRMKVLCIIDSLGSGGAQRQIINLALGLKKNGHEVFLLVFYSEFNFFREQLINFGIPIFELHKKKGFSIKFLLKFVSFLNEKKVDSVISFLLDVNLYTISAAVLSKKRFRLIVSDRSNIKLEKNMFISFFKRLIYFKADYVTANSYIHSAWLKNFFWLKSRVKTIYNGYDINRLNENQFINNSYEFDFLVVGRIDPNKNGLRLLQAVILYYSKYGISLKIAWAGRVGNDLDSANYFKKINALLDQNPAVKANWKWLGERDDIPLLLSKASALIHVSYYEGLPNAVCEAIVFGKPIVISDVCDNSILVEHKVRGMLCNPNSHISICEAIHDFMTLSAIERKVMADNAFEFAKKNLSLNNMVMQYESLLI